MKRVRKSFAALLVLAMLMTMLPAAVFAQGADGVSPVAIAGSTSGSKAGSSFSDYLMVKPFRMNMGPVEYGYGELTNLDIAHVYFENLSSEQIILSVSGGSNFDVYFTKNNVITHSNAPVGPYEDRENRVVYLYAIPKRGLPVGEYSETLTVSATKVGNPVEHLGSTSVTVTFKVTPKTGNKSFDDFVNLTNTANSPAFPDRELGYTPFSASERAAFKISAKSRDSFNLNLISSHDIFNVTLNGGTSAIVLPHVDAELFISPKFGLPVGTYYETVTIQLKYSGDPHPYAKQIPVSFTVTPAKPQSILISIGNMSDPGGSLHTGDDVKAFATVSPSQAGQDVTWSSNSSYATIDQSGNISVNMTERTNIGRKVTITATSKVDPSVKATKDITVYSHYHTLTLCQNPKNADIVTNPGQTKTVKTYASTTSPRIVPHTLPACDFEAPEGMVFAAWRIGSQRYQPGDTYTSEGRLTDTKVYAMWQKAYSVTVTNGGASKTQAIPGETVTLTADDPPAGKTFSRWSIDSGTITPSFDLTVPITSFTMPPSNVAFKAEYVDEPAGISYQINEYVDPEYTFPALPLGYGVEWHVNPWHVWFDVTNTGTKAVNMSVSGGGSVFSLNKSGGSNVAPGGDAYFIVHVNDGLAAGEYTEHVILTLTNTNDATQRLVKMLTFKVRVYDRCTVTFRDGDTVLSTRTVDLGAKVPKPSDPVKSGHTFKGWYADRAHQTPFDFSQGIDRDTDVYALFEEDAPAVTEITRLTISSFPADGVPKAGETLNFKSFSVTDNDGAWISYVQSAQMWEFQDGTLVTKYGTNPYPLAEHDTVYVRVASFVTPDGKTFADKLTVDGSALPEGASASVIRESDDWAKLYITMPRTEPAPSAGYDLWVGGIQVTSENMADVLGDGSETKPASVVFTPAESDSCAKLTLTDATISGAAIPQWDLDTVYGIIGGMDLTMELVGSNSITFSDSNDEFAGCIGIAMDSHLTVTGKGSLTVTADAGSNDNRAVFAYGLSMEGGTVRAAAESASGSSSGIYIRDNIKKGELGSGGDFVMNGGSLTASAGQAYRSFGIECEGSVTINGGTLTAVSTGSGSVYSSGISGDVAVNGGTVTAIGQELAFHYEPNLDGNSNPLITVNTEPSEENAVVWSEGDGALGDLWSPYKYVKIEPKAPSVHDVWWKYDGTEKTLHISDADNAGSDYALFSEAAQQGGAPWHSSKADGLYVVVEGTPAPVSTREWFSGWSNLKEIRNLGQLDTSSVTDMYDMFHGCSALTELDVSSFDTSSAGTVSGMFWGCSTLTELDVSSFNLSNAGNISGMFYECSGLETIYAAEGTDWNSYSASDTYLFMGCTALKGGDGTVYDGDRTDKTYARIDGLNGGKGYFTVKIDAYDLWLCSTRVDDTNKDAILGNGSAYFDPNTNTLTLNNPHGWMGATPNGASIESGSDLTISGAANIDAAYYAMPYAIYVGDGLLTLSGDFIAKGREYGIRVGNGGLKITGGTLIASGNRGAFDAAPDLSEYPNFMITVGRKADGSDAAPWRADEALTTYKYVKIEPAEVAGSDVWWKYDETETTLYISDADNAGSDYARFTAEAQRAADQFNSSTTYGWINDKTVTDSVTKVVIQGTPAPASTRLWFKAMFNLQVLENIDKLDTSRVTSMYYMFGDCYKLSELDLSAFNTAQVKEMAGMFSDCRSLTRLDLSAFDTSNVTGMSEMFSSCIMLSRLDLSAFDTSNVKRMQGMFRLCRSLSRLNLAGFDVSNVTDMRWMFLGCESLAVIYAAPEAEWSCNNMDAMFNGCTSLVGGNGTAYDADHVNGDYARIDGLNGLNGYFTEKGAGYRICGKAAFWKEGRVEYVLYSASVADKDIRGAWQKGGHDSMEGVCDAYTAETGNITGEKLDNKNMQTQSFSFVDVAPGEYKLAIFKEGGYVPKIVEVTVVDTDVDLNTTGTLKLWLYGDVNYDSAVDGTDAAQIQRYYANKAPNAWTIAQEEDKADMLLAADVSRDGEINGADASQVQRYYSNKTPNAFSGLR